MGPVCVQSQMNVMMTTQYFSKKQTLNHLKHVISLTFKGIFHFCLGSTTVDS